MSVTIQASELTWHSFTAVAPSEWRQEYLAEIPNFSVVVDTVPDSTVTGTYYSLGQYLREMQSFSVGVVGVNSFSIEDTISDAELEYRAVGAITALVKQNPLSLPLLLTAIEEGRVDGLTYGDYLHASDNTAPRCIVGWAMVATESVSTYDSHLRVTDRGYLEKYVFAVRAGETHLTNKRLAVLHAALVNMHVGKETDVIIAPMDDSTTVTLKRASERLNDSVTTFMESMEERMERTHGGQSAPEFSYA